MLFVLMKNGSYKCSLDLFWVVGGVFLEKLLSDNVLKYSQMFNITQPTQFIVYCNENVQIHLWSTKYLKS